MDPKNGNGSAVQNSVKTFDPRVESLAQKIRLAKLPEELLEKANSMIARLQLISHESGFLIEFDNISRYIDWICSLPWNNKTTDVLDLKHAQMVLDKNHYGLTDVKQKILEYLSIMIYKSAQGKDLNESFARAPIISLVGLVGVGKTTVAYSIAESLGRKIERIPFGGMGGAQMLRGQSRFNPEAEPGFIIKALKRAGTNNPVFLLDEIDRVSEEARGDIMGVLVELLDPEQNRSFVDHYIDFPVDLSNVLFIATSNNTKDISTAVLDRLELIQMPSYSDQEKIVIAKNYMFPKILVESGMSLKDIVVEDSAWEDIVRPLGYDSGIRSLKRTVEGMVRRVALFTLEGKIPKGQLFRVNRENIKVLVPQW